MRLNAEFLKNLKLLLDVAEAEDWLRCRRIAAITRLAEESGVEIKSKRDY
jgi:hypothetical protein